MRQILIVASADPEAKIFDPLKTAKQFIELSCPSKVDDRSKLVGDAVVECHTRTVLSTDPLIIV